MHRAFFTFAAISFVTSCRRILVAGLVPRTAGTAGTAGLVPGLVAVSSPPDSDAIRRFSCRPHHLLNMADVDCIRIFVRIHYPTGRRRLIRHQPSPPSCHRSRPRDRRDRRSRPHRTLSPPATSLVVPTISSTFSSKSAVAKFRNARQTKMADVDSAIQHRQVTLKNHCT